MLSTLPTARAVEIGAARTAFARVCLLGSMRALPTIRASACASSSATAAGPACPCPPSSLLTVHSHRPPAHHPSSPPPHPQGKISWDEFAAALGVDEAAADPFVLPLLAGGDSEDESGPPPAGPTLSGTVTIELDDGSEVEMDASAYMEQLKLEAQSLRAELTLLEGRETALQKGAGSLSGSISSYVSSLPEAQLKVRARQRRRGAHRTCARHTRARRTHARRTRAGAAQPASRSRRRAPLRAMAMRIVPSGLIDRPRVRILLAAP